MNSSITYRKQRLEREVLKTVTVILSYHVRDPQVGSMYVTKVELSEDLKFAHVYLFSEQVEDPDKIIKALISAGPFVESRLNKMIRWKRKISLALYFDQGTFNQVKIGKIIDGLSNGKKRESEE
ncbi:MAG: 30S ribosome-binding factor RbfA [Planctomycetes bacterium]|nr:30S ribosome-binding factor RbfA [Planctomycetota bacterium]